MFKRARHMLIKLLYNNYGADSTPGGAANVLLLESGSGILLESGFHIMLEG